MKKPNIIVLPRCYKLDDGRIIQYISENIRKIIIELGGIPVILCPTTNADSYYTKSNEFPEVSNEEKKIIDFYLNNCDGLIVPGGNKFTKFDSCVLDKAIKKNMPILCICMGMQLLSCYNNKDINLYKIDSKINHNQSSNDTNFSHKINIKNNSLLYSIIKKDEINVNSFHNMGCKDNNLFEIDALSEDNVIEAIEIKNKKFVLGVQWHPEKDFKNNIDSKNIFLSFINSARAYKNTAL